MVLIMDDVKEQPKVLADFALSLEAFSKRKHLTHSQFLEAIFFFFVCARRTYFIMDFFVVISSIQ